jgi:5,10-methylenetetrahydromethanopterin reductase
MVQIWTNGVGIPGAAARRAPEVEAAGFDGMTVVDSQNLSGDPYIALALAAKVTERLLLATGVTNPYTRHPAVTASSIATVQAESGGRAMLGIGRGDSALAHLGRSPVSVRVFEDYLQRVQGYLSGEEVPFEGGADLDRLRLANQPTASRIAWIRPGKYPKVPVDVAATGPRVIAAAARQADRISFAVGADPERIRWGLGVAREARERAGLDPNGIAYGAYVNVIAHPDRESARHLGEGGISLFTRFSAMHGNVVGPTSDDDRRVFESVHDAYDMTSHSRTGSQQAAQLSDEFSSRFAVLGPADYCVERLQDLVDLGLDRLIIVGPSWGANPGEAREVEERFVNDVMPTLRKG